MQQRLTSYTKKVNNTYKILELLADGSTKSQVARALGLSRVYVHKVAEKAVKQGLLKRVGRYPVLYYDTKKDVNQNAGLVARATRNKPLFRLHRIGFSYWLHTKIKTPKGYKTHNIRNWQQHVKREDGITIVLYPNKLHIWVALTSNKHIKEQLKHAKQLARARAEQVAQDNHVRISFDKEIAPPEAEVIDPTISAFLRKDMNVQNKPIQLKDATLLQDGSHDNPEITGKGAMDRAEAMRYFLDEGFDNMITMVERQNMLLKQVNDLNDAVDYLMQQKQKI